MPENLRGARFGGIRDGDVDHWHLSLDGKLYLEPELDNDHSLGLDFEVNLYDEHDIGQEFHVDVGFDSSRGNGGRGSRVSRELENSETEVETGSANFVVVFINDADESAAYGRGVDAAVKLLEDEGRQVRV